MYIDRCDSNIDGNILLPIQALTDILTRTLKHIARSRDSIEKFS